MMGTAHNVKAAMRSLHKYRENGDTWRGPSPLRPDSDSDCFSITFKDDEHALWHDHVAHVGGGLWKLAEMLGVPVEKTGTAKSASRRAYHDLADYAAEHGVGAEVFARAGWTQVERVTIAKSDGTQATIARPAIRFETANGPRYRFLAPDKSAPYMHDAGYKSCWYGLNGAIAHAYAKSLPLVLVNGEASTVAAQHFGVPACCATSSGEKALAPHLAAELREKWQGAILIALDCDKAGRDGALTLRAQLNELGYGEVIAVDLGLDAHDDMADFCKLYGHDANAQLRRLAQLEPAAPAALPQPAEAQASQLAKLEQTLRALGQAVRTDRAIRDTQAQRVLMSSAKALIEQLESADGQDALVPGEDIANAAIEDYMRRKRLREAGIEFPGLPTGFRGIDRLIDGLLPGVTVLLGATGMGKSFFACAVAANLIHAGYEGIAVTTEMNKGWFNRVAAHLHGGIPLDGIKRGAMTPEQEGAYADTMNFVERKISGVKGIRPTMTAVRATVLKAMAERRVDFVIVDSASRLVEPGDNIAGETAAVQNALQALAMETNLPFIVTGQAKGREIASRKFKMPTIVDAHGGSTWEHNADVLMGLYHHHYYVKQGLADEDANWPKGLFALRVLKNREGEDAADTIVKLQFVNNRGLFEHRPEPLPARPRRRDIDDED